MEGWVNTEKGAKLPPREVAMIRTVGKDGEGGGDISLRFGVVKGLQFGSFSSVDV